ncbi:MAG: hypothetical protein HWE30_06930 [Methylocystaceae bacterium]|nr:hypothetical protein [Methylocystaceae bacterium]
MKPQDQKYRLHKSGLALACASMLILSGCTSNFMIGDAVSTIATDKTMGDHIISYFSRKDCSTVRQEQGLSYCKEDTPDPSKAPKTHCYRELGKVTCYEEADLTSIRAPIEDRKDPVHTWKKSY